MRFVVRVLHAVFLWDGAGRDWMSVCMCMCTCYEAPTRDPRLSCATQRAHLTAGWPIQQSVGQNFGAFQDRGLHSIRSSAFQSSSDLGISDTDGAVEYLDVVRACSLAHCEIRTYLELRVWKSAPIHRFKVDKVVMCGSSELWVILISVRALLFPDALCRTRVKPLV